MTTNKIMFAIPLSVPSSNRILYSSSIIYHCEINSLKNIILQVIDFYCCWFIAFKEWKTVFMVLAISCIKVSSRLQYRISDFFYLFVISFTTSLQNSFFERFLWFSSISGSTIHNSSLSNIYLDVVYQIEGIFSTEDTVLF